MDKGICIVGGGAAGLAAAVMLRGKGLPVTVLEALPRVGKKLLATGNGRCNLTNLGATPVCYRGDGELLDAVLNAFPPERTLDFFRGLGLYTVTEDGGRVYPRSQTAASVLDALRLKCDALGVNTLCGQRVTALRRSKRGFTLTCGEENYRFDAVLLTCGSRAASNIDGYDLLKALGLTMTPIVPALCPVPVKGDGLKAVKGLRTAARVMLLAEGAPARDAMGKALTAEGEVQFGDRTLSGICVFDLSRWVNLWQRTGVLAGRRVKRLTIALDLLPEVENKHALLRELAETAGERTAEDWLSGLFPKRLGQVLLKSVYGGPLNVPVGKLPGNLPERLADVLSCWEFEPDGLAPWNQAQLAAGGVSAESVNCRTLEAVGCEGLYLAGELLDADGPCGGYNLQWAWASAYCAARGIWEKFA